MRGHARCTTLLLAVACSIASCLISPKDYPLETSSPGGDGSGGSDNVGTAGKHALGDGGVFSADDGEPMVVGDAGSQTRAGSSNGGSFTLGGAGSGGLAGSGGSGGSSGGGPVDPACTDHPLSAGATWLPSASASSINDPPAHMVDGNLNARWSTGKEQAGDEWIQIDFGMTVALSSVTLAAGADTNDFPRAYALRVSATALDFAAPILASGGGKVGDNTITLAKVATGRYLTIKQTATSLSWWSISELTVTCGATQPAGCAALPTWETKSYSIGDQVRSTCTGVFASPCPAGEPHTFECNPAAGQAAIVWCQQREPGVGNNWSEAWVDKGKCP